jgi:hypothetical protein
MIICRASEWTISANPKGWALNKQTIEPVVKDTAISQKHSDAILEIGLDEENKGVCRLISFKIVRGKTYIG